jgi:hypothetical protein
MDQVKVRMYEGMASPTVEVPNSDGGSNMLSVVLDRLDEEFHDQSYGLVESGTGCWNNPGGPRC